MARLKRRSTNQSSDTFPAMRASSQGKRGPGRPPLHSEAWTKVTVVLFDRQIDFLDSLATNIRARSGAALSRAQLIRALVDAVADVDIDLSAIRSEADMKATLLSRMAASTPPPDAAIRG
jgi:hypothetical protein